MATGSKIFIITELFLDFFGEAILSNYFLFFFIKTKISIFILRSSIIQYIFIFRFLNYLFFSICSRSYSVSVHCFCSSPESYLKIGKIVLAQQMGLMPMKVLCFPIFFLPSSGFKIPKELKESIQEFSKITFSVPLIISIMQHV